MSTQFESVFAAAMELSDEERERLAARLLGSVQELNDEAWDAEVEASLAAIDAGEEETLTWGQVKASLLAIQKGQ